jgi:nicotinate-nucleotide adenylyltransferase
MKIAFFGGTFDPVHRGHLAVARAAAEKFGLNRIYFAPADIPPHKQKRKLTDFQHRFAMLALATDGDQRFIPSLLDARTGRPNYSLDTVRRLKSTLAKSDKLYFLIGMDAFEEISTWHRPVELLGECEFIVVSRPGFSLGDAARALPEAVRPPGPALRALNRQQAGTIDCPGVTIHLLDEVWERVSSTQIRAAAHRSLQELSRWVPQPVAEYIRKEHLYVESARKQGARSAPHGKMLSLHRGTARSRRHE